MKLKPAQIIIMAVAILIIAGGAFWGGMAYQKSRQPTTLSRSGGPQGGGFGGGQFNGANRPTFGQVSSINSTDMVVASRFGGNVTVQLDSNPTVTDGSGNSASVSDIQTGDTVIVQGSKNSDGSITAQSIRINPSFGGGSSSNQN